MSLRTVAGFLSLCVLAACHDEGPRGGVDNGRAGSGGGGSNGGPLPGDPCSYSLDFYRERIAGEDTTPTWTQIDCFTKGLARRPMPAFIKRYNLDGGHFMMQEREGQKQWATFDAVSANPAVNISSGMFSGMPPFFDLAAQKVYEFPLSPAHLDAKLRGAAPFFLTDKRKGWRTIFSQFYPPGTVVPGVVDAASYKKWVTDFLVAEKITEAKYAERLQIEAYSPLLGEVEIMINNLPFAASMPVTDRVALGQWTADTLRDAVRPHFKGHLVGFSYTRYEVTGPEWANLSFAGWDSVTFGVFPECDLETVKRYLQSQLPLQMKVVANSQNIPWAAGEVFVRKGLFANSACLTDAQFTEIEPAIYQTIIDAIEAQPRKPAGLLVDHYLIQNPQSFNVIESYWNSKPN